MSQIGYALMGFVSLLFFFFTIAWGLGRPNTVQPPVSTNEIVTTQKVPLSHINEITVTDSFLKNPSNQRDF